jgi:hypothetical protein
MKGILLSISVLLMGGVVAHMRSLLTGARSPLRPGVSSLAV